MNRIEIISNQLAGSNPNVVYDSLDFLKLHDLLTPQENAIRLQVREFAEKEVRLFLIYVTDRSDHK